jgi:hypothetical protein
MKIFLFTCYLCGTAFIQGNVQAMTMSYEEAEGLCGSLATSHATLAKITSVNILAVLSIAKIMVELAENDATALLVQNIDAVIRQQSLEEFGNFFEEKFVPYAEKEHRDKWAKLKSKLEKGGRLDEKDRQLALSISDSIKNNIAKAYKDGKEGIGKNIGVVEKDGTSWTGTLIKVNGATKLNGRIVLTVKNNVLEDENGKGCDFLIKGKQYIVQRCRVNTEKNIAVLILDRAVEDDGGLPIEATAPLNATQRFFNIGHDSNFGSVSPRATQKYLITSTTDGKIDTAEIRAFCTPGDNGAPIIFADDAGCKIVGIYTQAGENSWELNDKLIRWISEALTKHLEDAKTTQFLIDEKFDEAMYMYSAFCNEIAGRAYTKDPGWTSLPADDRLAPFVKEINELASQEAKDTLFDDAYEATITNLGIAAAHGARLGEKLKEKLKTLDVDSRHTLSLKFFEVGNCGALANYFMAHKSDLTAKQARTHENILQEIVRCFANPFMIFRIFLNGSHTFVGIKRGDKIEILQAWFEKYTVHHWLNSKKTCYYTDQFMDILGRVTSDVEKAESFYNTGPNEENLFVDSGAEKKEDKIKVQNFSYTVFDNETALDAAIRGCLAGNSVAPQAAIKLETEQAH